MTSALCLIVPCYNEEEMLPTFFEVVIPELNKATNGSWRIVCVDDGSRDNTFAIIAQRHAAEPRVTGVRLSRNFGHQAAVSVGLAYASGDYIGVIDCDLQDPIHVLIQLYQKALGEKLDVCYGIRGRRDASFLLKFAYFLFYRVIERMAEHSWPKDAGDFCVMSARCNRVLLSLPEQSRMMRGLRSWVGFKQAGLAYDRPARLHGTTKYNFSRLLALAMQGLIAFSSIPLRLASLVGIAMAVFSIVFALLVLVNRLMPRFTVFSYWVGANPGTTTILIAGSFISSILFLSLGIIGEYLVVMLQEIKRRPTAIVQSIIGDICRNEPGYSLAEAIN
jgi:dolichol-phosphate mannosyltransferase